MRMRRQLLVTRGATVPQLIHTSNGRRSTSERKAAPPLPIQAAEAAVGTSTLQGGVEEAAIRPAVFQAASCHHSERLEFLGC